MCYNTQCLNPCLLSDPCAANAECYGANHRAQCRCPAGLIGNPQDRCIRVECRVDRDCPNNKTCRDQVCVNPCSNSPCASNALCYVSDHSASCRCPEDLPEGDPRAFCYRTPPTATGPECRLDVDCPSRLACISGSCTDPCRALKPCSESALCGVLDSVPVRTMVCTCPDGWVPDQRGECTPVVLPIPPGCTRDDDCSSNETCINRMCRNPCDCGANAQCYVSNHRPICSCQNGFGGNPEVACHPIGCRSDAECDSGKACVNGNCINPCVVSNPCARNAECYVVGSRAECRCPSGYRGDPRDRCMLVGCRANNDCPSDRACVNGQCLNPCLYENPCSSRAECSVHNHLAVCRCPPGLLGNPYVDCRPEMRPECRVDTDCPSRLACLDARCQDPCSVIEPCQRPSTCEVVPSNPVRTMLCVCPSGYISSGSGTCKPTPPVLTIGECAADPDCPAEKACVNGLCRDPCDCGPNAECRIRDHKPVCSCPEGFQGTPELECRQIGCRSDTECALTESCVNRNCVPVCDNSTCGAEAICYSNNHRAMCECPPGRQGNPKDACILVTCTTDSDCPSTKACVNAQCVNPCDASNPCVEPAECKVYNHQPDCSCPPGYLGDLARGCFKEDKRCKSDTECPSQTACINGDCVNPCLIDDVCGVNAECTTLDTTPIRTMTCECLPGYQGNAAVECVKGEFWVSRSLCSN